MDTGSGHIWEPEKINIKDIKGRLVPWQVGEKIIVKECSFEVKEIRTFPTDEIVLKGKANEMFKDEFQKADQESQHKIMDFVRGGKK